jgi:ribosomal protein S6--L-glutamate ligase
VGGPLAKILTLSRNPKLYSTRRLAHEAKVLGHDFKVVDPLRCQITIDNQEPLIHYQGKRLATPDVVLPRIGASITAYGLAVVNQLEMMGMAIVNRSQAIARARDKLRASQLLSRHGISTPRTVFLRDPDQVALAVELVGGCPAITKLTQGTQGVGVMIAESVKSLEAMLETFWAMGQDIIIQEFIRESRGKDIRAFVIGNRVVGAMRRQAKVGEFRSNIHRGGVGRPVNLDPDYEKAALMATRVMGLQVAGVDILEGKDGPKVIEVNASPGFEGLERATGRNVARQFIEYAAQYAEKWSESTTGVNLLLADS